jgi:hypothetical protein
MLFQATLRKHNWRTAHLRKIAWQLTSWSRLQEKKKVTTGLSIPERKTNYLVNSYANYSEESYIKYPEAFSKNSYIDTFRY